MLKPSDFNNAVPQFSNGNYASNPINPQYVEEPSSTDYNRGTEPLQTLPAQWWNWFMNKFTSRFNKVNIYVKNLFNELAQLLSLVNVTPDGTESAVTDGQLKNAFKELYPDYINTKLALESTYVKKTQKVNNHALSGNVTVTKSDVGLGNVANTGDSATPVSGGTTKFTTGGAYTELNKKADKTQLENYQPNNFLSLSSDDANDVDVGIKCYRVGGTCANIPVNKIGLLTSYKYVSAPYIRITQEYAPNDDTVNSSKKYLRWGMSNNNGTSYTWSNWQQVADNAAVNLKADLLDLAPAFSTSTSYAVGDYITYNDNMYRCTVAHSAGAWNASHFTSVTVGDELENLKQTKTESRVIDLANYTTAQYIAIADVTSWVDNQDTFGGPACFVGTINTSRPYADGNNQYNVLSAILMVSGSTIDRKVLTIKYLSYDHNTSSTTFKPCIFFINNKYYLGFYIYPVDRMYLRLNGIFLKTLNSFLSFSNATIYIEGESIKETSSVTQNSRDVFTSGGAYTELAKKVDKTTTVNGHALSGNVTVTKGDVGLGNVANTGDSATPSQNGTTKFTTGGAYNLLTSLAPIFSTATSYAVGDMVTYNGMLYTCTTAHSAGAWNASHFTVANLNTELAKKFNASSAGDQVTYSLSGNTLTITSLA